MKNPEQRRIDFNENAGSLFTKAFHEVRRAKTRYIIVYGGSGSSKSYSVHQSELITLMQSGKGDTLVIRKYGADHRHSCYKLFNQLISKYGLGNYFTSTFSNDNRCITYTPNNRSFVFRGVDDTEKLKSIVAFSRIIIEEASQLTFDDFLELNRRARGMDDIQIVLILNPISENHWIKTKFCDEYAPYADETTVLKFTYHDNISTTGHSFLTPADIRELERLKEINENQYRIYVEGQWGIDNQEGKFCWAFNRSQIKCTQLDDDNGVWATFDFNVNPITCTVAQVYPDTKTLRAIDCIKLNNSDIWQMCDRLNAAYPDVLWYVTGDATGQSRSAMVRDSLNYYHIIMEQLNLNPQQVRLPSVNPPVEDNQVLVNAVHKKWTVEIDPNRCQPLIYDLMYVEITGAGAIVKDRTTTKKYADFLDNWRYLLNMAVKPHIDFWRK